MTNALHHLAKPVFSLCVFLLVACGPSAEGELRDGDDSLIDTHTEDTATEASSIPPDAHEAADIIVTVLGSGTPVPSATQFGSAVLVQAAGKHFMFDCGRGCTTRLAQLDPSLIAKVDHLFVTHFHSDHLMGIDDLLLNGWTQGRKAPLKTWGPVGTNDMMLAIQEAFRVDIDQRKSDGVPAPSAALDDYYTDLPAEGGLVLDEDGIKITAFIVDHGSVEPAYGYKLEYNGRAVVISGDTTETPSLYEYGRGADVLLLEVVSPSMTEYIATHFSQKQLEKVLSLHLTAEQASDIFNGTNPRIGVYYHTSRGGNSVDSLLSVTNALYAGEVVVSHDLFQILVGEQIYVRDMSPEGLGG
ncbi:MAG: MBL fold metallo-hydrolase [Pseudomonadota bacterium]